MASIIVCKDETLNFLACDQCFNKGRNGHVTEHHANTVSSNCFYDEHFNNKVILDGQFLNLNATTIHKF